MRKKERFFCWWFFFFSLSLTVMAGWHMQLNSLLHNCCSSTCTWLLRVADSNYNFNYCYRSAYMVVIWESDYNIWGGGLGLLLIGTKREAFNLNQSEINAILILKPLYNLFITIAKLFQQVGAKCITLYVLAPMAAPMACNVMKGNAVSTQNK